MNQMMIHYMIHLWFLDCQVVIMKKRFAPEGEEFTSLDLLVALVSKRGQADYSGVAHSMTIRVPSDLFFTVEALCKHSGHSRNKMVAHLLEVAIDSLCESLPREDFEAISKIRSEMRSDFVSGVQSGSKRAPTLDTTQEGKQVAVADNVTDIEVAV